MPAVAARPAAAKKAAPVESAQLALPIEPPAPAAPPPPPGPAAAADPADHDDPRFLGVLDAFAADPALCDVAEDFAAEQAAGGQRKFGSRALKVDGKIFAMLSHGRFVVKLPPMRVDALVASGDGDYFDPGHGRKMKQWLELTSSRPSWIELAKEAYAFVGDL